MRVRHSHAVAGKSDTSDSGKSDKSKKSSKSAPSARRRRPATKAKTHQSATARHHRRSGFSGNAPAPLPASGQDGGQTAPSTPAPTASPSPSSSGSSNLKSDVRKDIADGNYLMAVGQYMVENGYSKAAAAGIASCVEGESGGNPELVGDGGAGLISWTPVSSAAPNPNIITGNPAQDMTTQLADILYYNSTEIGQSLVSQLDAISDPVQAADFYSQNFEKPAVTDSDVVPSVAEQIYSELGG
jgi:hypothetical protein